MDLNRLATQLEVIYASFLSISTLIAFFLYLTWIGLNNRFGNASPRGGANFDTQSLMQGADNTAHLKGKLSNLNETIR